MPDPTPPPTTDAHASQVARFPPCSPVVLFVYNRPLHTRRTVESLLQNPLAARSDLWIVADGAKSAADAPAVQQVRDFIRTVGGFGSVTRVERPHNVGLANSVIDGVSQVLARHPAAIVLEDDLEFTPDFLAFMNDCLAQYHAAPRIFSVSGYLYPIRIPPDYPADVCTLPRASSWGWATWADRWQRTDWHLRDYARFARDPAAQRAFAQGGEDLPVMLKKQQLGRIDSWAIRWNYAHYQHDAYCLHAVHSKVQNTGLDNSGTHSPKSNRFRVELRQAPCALPTDPPPPDARILASLRRLFRLWPWRRLINYVTLR